MSLPRVSIIVCTYNNGATLARSLESLAAQDYPNFHVVVVDDCSSDDSIAVALEYQARFPDLVRSVKNERNLGLVGNYAAGHRFIEGKYAMLGGPDDTWNPRFLSEMIKAFEKSSAAVAGISSVNSTYDDGNSTVYRYPEVDIYRCAPSKLLTVVLNGVTSRGKSSPYNSMIQGVVKSAMFRTIYPDNKAIWFVELNIVVIQILLGGLVTVDEALHIRHRVRKPWNERYPDDDFVEGSQHAMAKLRSAWALTRHVLACRQINTRNKLRLPGVIVAILVFQIIRPRLGPALKRLLPQNAFAFWRNIVYRLFSSRR